MIDDVLEREHQGWQSLCDGMGADFYGQLMTPDGLMLLAHGQILDRQDVIDSLGQAPRWDTYEIVEPRLVAAAEDRAVLVYTGRAARSGEAPFVALMASVYVQVDHEWRLALYQQTPVPSAA